MIEWDERKRAATLALRGVDFASMARFDWASAVILPDDRADYGEPRLRVSGLIDGRLHMAIVTGRAAAAHQPAQGECKGAKAMGKTLKADTPDTENPEWTDEDFARAEPLDGFPELAHLIRQGRPPLPEAERKQRVTIYLDREVVERLKAEGKGWQTRANARLRKALGL